MIYDELQDAHIPHKEQETKPISQNKTIGSNDGAEKYANAMATMSKSRGSMLCFLNLFMIYGGFWVCGVGVEYEYYKKIVFDILLLFKYHL